MNKIILKPNRKQTDYRYVIPNKTQLVAANYNFILLMLLEQSIILNLIYKTNLFDKIVLPSTSQIGIDYHLVFEIYQMILQQKITKPPIKLEYFLKTAHSICQIGQAQQLKQNLLLFNDFMEEINFQAENIEDPYCFFHVIMYSSLSKCSSWREILEQSQLEQFSKLKVFYKSFRIYFNKILEEQINESNKNPSNKHIIKKKSKRGRCIKQNKDESFDIQRKKLKKLKSSLQKKMKEKCSYQYLTKTYLSQSELDLYKQTISKIGLLKVHPIIIKDQQELDHLLTTLKKKKIIGIDIEYYSSKTESFICLVQISSFDEVFIIDCLFHQIYEGVQAALVSLFKNDDIIKIFHAFDNDLKWLIQAYKIEEFNNIIDTQRIGKFIKGHRNSKPSLKDLVRRYLKLQINKFHQKSDWSQRPLSMEMLEYASLDAKLLPYLLIKMVETHIKDKKISDKQGISTVEQQEMTQK